MSAPHVSSGLAQRSHVPLGPPASAAQDARPSAIARFLQGLRRTLQRFLPASWFRPRPIQAHQVRIPDAQAAPPPSAAALRNRYDLDRATLDKGLDAALSGLTLSGLAEALPRRQEQLFEVERGIILSRQLDDPAREALRQRLVQVQGQLARLERRGADQAALAAEAPRLQQALGGLPPLKYAQARASLDQVLATLAATPRALVMGRLDDLIRSADATPLLDDLARGDAAIVDLVFAGADWDEDALALKLAGLPPGDEKALRNLDVQHNLRMVSQELNAFMASRNAAKGRQQLPVSLFSAVKADKAVIGWLVQYAAEEVGARNAQIGAWISLSLYDPALGAVDQKQVDALLTQLHGEGLDTAQLREHIRQGFSNTAEVVECRDLMQKVARACQESVLLESLDERRFPVLQASRVVRDLFREATGLETEVATGQEVDEALAEAADQAMPWLRYEQDLPAARRELAQQLTGLYSASFALEDHAQADRRWLADPAQLQAATPDHERVRDILYYDTRIKALQPRKAEPEVQAEIAQLAQALGRLRQELVGFSPTHLRRQPGLREAPSLSALRAIAVEMDSLARLPTLHQRVALLEQAARPTEAQRRQAAGLLERLRQIAVLQVGIESADEAFAPNGRTLGQEGYAAQVLKRLDAFGISTRRPSPFLKDAVNQAAAAISQDGRSLRELASAYDPQALRAKAVSAVRRLSGGKRGSGSAPAPAAGTLAVPAPGAASVTLSEAQRRQRAALASIERQVRELQPQQAFDVRMGVYGTVSVGAPVVPGLSTASDLRAERQNGLRVTLQADGSYVVRVQAGGAVRHGVSLSALSDLISFRGESELAREKGFDLRFEDQGSCLAMLRGLVTGGEVDPAAWAPASVQRVERRELQGRASLTASAQLTLATLSAEVAAAVGNSYELQRSASGEVETQGRRTRLGATVGAQAAAGGPAREATVGLALSATRRLHRQFGMLRPGCEMTLAATVVGGNVDACLSQLLPGLSDAQREAMKATLRGETGVAAAADKGQLPDGSELFVRYTLRPQAMREANAELGRASAALTRASLASGEARQAALDEARAHARSAHEITRRPGSYAMAGWGWTLHSQAEVGRHRGAYQQFARGESVQTQLRALDSATPGQAASSAGEPAEAAPVISPALAALLS